MPLVKRMPLPSLTGVKSILSEPGTESASYQVETFVVPSLSYSVVFWTNVAVLYQDLPYFFCISWIRSSLVLIFAAQVTGTIAITQRVNRIERIDVSPLKLIADKLHSLSLAALTPSPSGRGLGRGT